MLITSIFSFSHNVFKGYFPRVIKSLDFVDKELNYFVFITLRLTLYFICFIITAYPEYNGGSQVTEFAAQMILPDNTSREVYKGRDLDCIVAGLQPGRPYLFQVRAFNRAGVSFLILMFHNLVHFRLLVVKD